MVSSISIEGSLNNSDFILDSTGLTPIRADEFDLDITGTSAIGQTLTISLSSTDNGFDPVLEIINPATGLFRKFDRNNGGGNNEQITSSDNITVPNDGKLKLRVTNSSFNPNLNSEENPYIINVNLPSDDIDIKLQSQNTLFANPITGSSESPAIVEGKFDTKDPNFTRNSANTRADEYKLESTVFDRDITIALTREGGSTNDYDPFLQVIDADTGKIIADSDDNGTNDNALITIGQPANGAGLDDPIVPNSLTVRENINYIIRVTSFGDFPGSNGVEEVDYKLEVTPASGEVTVSPRIPIIKPNITISDAAMAEGNDGKKILSFDVTLSEESNAPVTVNYATQDDTAKVENDYTAIANTELTFEPGEVKKTIDVQVTGDTDIEADETFFVNLSNAINANITDAQGVGTIDNDDNNSSNGGNGSDNPTTPPTALELTGGTAQIAYVAYYGRPADDGGLRFWNDALTENNISYAPREGDRLTGNEQEIYDRIVNQFGNSEEADRLFGDLSDREKLNRVYQFAFDRNGDEGGLNFWQEQLDLGNVTIATFAMEVALGAQNEDITILNNKIASADLFSESINTEVERDAYSGSTGEIFGREWLDDFDDAISTQAQVDSALADLVNS